MDCIPHITYYCEVFYIDLSYYDIMERSFERRWLWDL
jgi:hypothetical protein